LDEIAFDYSDIKIPTSKSKKKWKTHYLPKIEWGTMYGGSTHNPYVSFRNFPKESLYKKQLSESDYQNLRIKYEIWKNNEEYRRPGEYGQRRSWFLERDRKYIFADLFKKGTSPYIVGIMISNKKLRIYRFLNEKSFSIISNYLKQYLYNIDFSITQILSEKLEGMYNNEIVLRCLLNLKPVHRNKYGTIAKSTFNLQNRIINPPIEFLKIPPAIDWRLLLALDFENEYILPEKVYERGKYVYKTEPYEAYWGKISFLPAIKTNKTFTTIEDINLEVTPDVLSKLTGIKIAIDK
jgi:hypothetical protein